MPRAKTPAEFTRDLPEGEGAGPGKGDGPGEGGGPGKSGGPGGGDGPDKGGGSGEGAPTGDESWKHPSPPSTAKCIWCASRTIDAMLAGGTIIVPGLSGYGPDGGKDIFGFDDDGEEEWYWDEEGYDGWWATGTVEWEDD